MIREDTENTIINGGESGAVISLGVDSMIVEGVTVRSNINGEN